MICLYVLQKWQSLWEQQIGNKLHHLKPHIGRWLLNLPSTQCEEVVLVCLHNGYYHFIH